ncbi:hypothetical protein B566_EDAN010172 [Ephemera danica]|nr:hypothetical protein B566_EDAN010172 [Ephemera danica]
MEPLKRIYWEADGTCRLSSDSSVCRSGNQLALDFDGTGVCRCKPGYAKIRGATEDNCMALYRSYGKCRKGQYLVPAGDGWAHCARNTCPRENMARWTDGQCYQLDTQGPCPERKDLLRVDADTGELNCTTVRATVHLTGRKTNSESKISRVPTASETSPPNHQEEQTTETELSAMAADAIQGCRWNPRGLNTPAARGIPTRLYMLAKMKFIRIRRTVFRDKSKQPITSRRSFWGKNKVAL